MFIQKYLQIIYCLLSIILGSEVQQRIIKSNYLSSLFFISVCVWINRQSVQYVSTKKNKASNAKGQFQRGRAPAILNRVKKLNFQQGAVGTIAYQEKGQEEQNSCREYVPGIFETQEEGSCVWSKRSERKFSSRCVVGITWDWILQSL